MSLAGRSLAPLYGKDANLFHVMYNDEHPHGPTSFDKGHTKVMFLFVSACAVLTNVANSR